jgi:hypothetical protein
MKKGMIAFVVLAFALAVAAPLFAEEAGQEKAETKAPLRKELIQLKYLRAGGDLYGFINAYLSRDGHIAGGPTKSVVVVSDYPENVEKVLQAIRQIDIKPADLQFTVQLVLGSDTEEKGSDTVANDPIIKELRNLLKYKSYSLLDTSMVRAMDDNNSEVRMGEKAEFEFQIRPKVIKDEKSSLIQMEVRLRQVQVVFPSNATKADYVTTDLIGTTLNIKSGDKTVVGVSKLDGGGKGLILIISGKIVE